MTIRVDIAKDTNTNMNIFLTSLKVGIIRSMFLVV